MRFLRKHLFWIFLFGLVAGLVSAPSGKTVRTRLADGFDQPVGKPDADGYYRARGFRPRYHMGEDWNGLGGGNSDLGKPVYSTANGIVVMARDMRSSWGNLVIVRHVFLENREMKTVDSVYAHLDKIMAREGQQVVRGQQIGTIGTNRGMYPAHLHFEIRKNLNIGHNQRGFSKDYTNYYSPIAFIQPRRKLPGGGRSALVEVDTFQLSGTPAVVSDAPPDSNASPPASRSKKPTFRVNRYDDR